MSGDRSPYQDLIKVGALVHVGNAEALLCTGCDSPHSLAVEYDGARYCGYCADSGLQYFEPDEVRRYAVREDWIASAVRTSLSRKPARTRPAQKGLSEVHRIGDARFGPYRCAMFFCRRLFDKDRCNAARDAIERLAGNSPSILLTTTRVDSIAGEAPTRCAIVSLGDVLSFEGGGPAFDERPVMSALRGRPSGAAFDGIGLAFSPGFRSATWGEFEFTFTKKQALVVEALYEARQRGVRQMHQSELLGIAGTSQRIVQLFDGHPAYGTFIKHDGNSYYRLEL